MGARVMALQEQAEELGFSTIQDAIDAGYEVAYKASGNHQLYKPDEQELAHRAWLEEKETILKELSNLQEIIETLADGEPHEVSSYWADTIWSAINFVKKGEC